MWSPLRTPDALSAVWRIVSRAKTREGSPGSLSVSGHPSLPAGASSARAELKPAVDERTVEAPLLEQFRHQIHRVALADATEIEPNAAGRRVYRKVSASISSDGSPVPIATSNAPSVRSYKCRAMRRHSSAASPTRALSPAVR